MTDRELMQMALDALEWCYDVTEWPANGKSAQDKAIEALRARLAQPEPEPVAWVAYENGEKHGIDFDEDEIANLPVGTMLYAAPPKIFCGCGDQIMPDDGAECGTCVTARNAVKEWVGLTENEIKHLWYEACQTNLELTSQLVVHLARNVEAKLKEKNA